MIIEDTADKITTMEIRGAGKIGRAAAQAMKEFAQGTHEDDPNKFIAALEKARDTLMQTRPTAVSLENALAAVMVGVQGSTVNEIRQSVANAADKFISHSLSAVETIAELCANRIKDGNVIMTHCNSSVVVRGIIKAHEQKKKIRIFATETRPWHQGYITSQALAEAGVDTTLIVDSAVRLFLAETDLVIVGADTVTANGTLYNKIGTSQIALCAHELGVPVIVCAETYKFSKASANEKPVTIEERDTAEIVEPGRLKGVKLRNPVFDATPPEYITEIITEYGIIAPKDAKSIILRSS